MKHYIFVIMLAITSAFALSGCETIKGAGQDIENAGEGIEDAVE